MHLNMLAELLKKNSAQFSKIVPFDAEKDKLLILDFTVRNKSLTEEILADTLLFSDYINEQLSTCNAKYGIGGYNEHRTIYSRSDVFNSKEEPRRLHLGIDIWGKAKTPIYAPIGGMVHSFAFNNQFGDYGATIILLHQINTVPFYTLYGHLSLADIAGLNVGKYFLPGDLLAHFGSPNENGNWPPHLHFQIIEDIGLKDGDYPGVCKLSESAKYLQNCLNPDLIINMMQYI